MTALASVADVEAQLSRSLTEGEYSQVSGLLDIASAYVRRRTGHRFEAGTYTVRRRATGGRVTIDGASSVRSVHSIARDGSATPLGLYTVRGSTIYGLGSACWVEVQYTSDGEVPDDIRLVTAAVAKRMLEAPGSHLQSQTKGPFSETYRDAAPVTTAAEDAILSGYGASRATSVSLL